MIYTTEAVANAENAQRIIRYYELRWTIEDFHKCLKTGCAIESRRYQTADRLERVVGLLAIVAIRLLRMRTAAKTTPECLASDVAPQSWVDMLRIERKIPLDRIMTIREFVRALAGLGGFLGRKSDGNPGWQTLWRGYEKLQLLMRGFNAAIQCG